MMQSCASAAKLRGGGSILHSGFEAMVLRRITATSDRHRQTRVWAANLVILFVYPSLCNRRL
jgi:hypothetical protein